MQNSKRKPIIAATLFSALTLGSFFAALPSVRADNQPIIGKPIIKKDPPKKGHEDVQTVLVTPPGQTW